MKKALIVFVAILLVVVALQAKGLTVREFELEIWRSTNAERAKYGVAPLAYDESFAELAKLHSKNMVTRKFFSHQDHLGDFVAERKTRYLPNLLVTSIGENLGKFTNSAKAFSPQECVAGWMNSPDHRKNILDPDYTHLGIGIIIIGTELMATQVFGTPIVRLNSKLPKKLDPKKAYILSFTYLSNKPLDTFKGTLVYPDPNVAHKISDSQEMLGAQPIPIQWKDAQNLQVTVPFAAGKGNYKLCFGWNGGYYPEGINLLIK